MDPLILYRSLKVIEEIYDESMYGENDIFRIKDVVHSLDDNHWRGKKWMADLIKNYHRHNHGNILVMGGWYGLMAYQLRKLYPNESMNITTIDMDPRCAEIGYKLFHDQKISFKTGDVKDLDIWDYSIIVNTSVEHMDREFVKQLITNKDPNTVLGLQSNDYYDELSHINCDDSVDNFVQWVEPMLSESKVRYWGTMQLSTFKRFSIVGM